MNTTSIWIIFPGVLAVILYLFRNRERAIALVGVGVSLLLSWLAGILPFGERISLHLWSGFPSFTIETTLTVLGRRFILDDSSRPLLIFIYLGLAFWFGGSRTARTSRLFIPLGLGMAALFTAALAVVPFLYAALLIEMAAMLSLPLLSPPGNLPGKGALRFLTFQTLGIPFILIAGWILPQIEANPAGSSLAVQAAFFAVLGFSLFLAVFPFHTWIPMAAEEAPPYAAAFVFFLLTGAVSMFSLEFLGRYSWLQNVHLVFQVIRFLGVLMVALGGVYAAFQHHLGRILAYAVIVEIGHTLLALSLLVSPVSALAAGNTSLLDTSLRTGIFYSLLLPRGVGLGLWALGLSGIYNKTNGLSFRLANGAGRSLPFSSAGLLLANLSLAGLPLLAGFPVRIVLWSAISEQDLLSAIFTLLGSAGLMVAAVRSLAVLVTGDENQDWKIEENRGLVTLLSLAIFFLLLIGVAPQLFLPALAQMSTILTIPR